MSQDTLKQALQKEKPITDLKAFYTLFKDETLTLTTGNEENKLIHLMTPQVMEELRKFVGEPEEIKIQPVEQIKPAL